MRARRGTLLGLIAAAALTVPSGASASTIAVTSTADSSGAACTLRDAISAANSNAVSGACAAGQAAPTVDQIDLSALSGSIQLATPLPQIGQTVAIEGPGAALLTVSGGGAIRPFSNGGSGVTISNVAIDNGRCDIVCGSQGGAIANTGVLTLDSVEITGSVASAENAGTNSFAEGGAIENNNSANLTVLDSKISGNLVQASDGGSQNGASAGAIMNRGTLTVTRSTISDNTAQATPGNGATGNVTGGAIANNGMLMIYSSTLSGNSAIAAGTGTSSTAGGAISQFNNSATSLIIQRSTIADNLADNAAASSQAGGVQLIGNQGSIASSTITGNTATSGANLVVSKPAAISNSVITVPVGGSNCAGQSLLSAGFNIESTDTCGLTATSDQVSTDPMLGALANNGGSTQTRIPLTGSPAIDAGHAFVGESADQRGELRPSDIFSIANASGGDGSDVGAVEVQDTEPPDTVIDSGPADGSTTKDNTPRFAWHSTETNFRFECAKDVGAGGQFKACGMARVLGHVSDGHHTYSVRAIDPNGNTDPTPAIRSYTVDTKAPKTTIGKLKRKTTKHTVKVKLKSSEKGSSFKCAVDGKPYKGCKSPLKIKHLKIGKHKVMVKAIDVAGNTDKTAAKKTFKVVAKR